MSNATVPLYVLNHLVQRDHPYSEGCSGCTDAEQAWRKANVYDEQNPMGGPASVFDCIASRIRAGEEYQSVLDDYGLMHKVTAPAQSAQPVEQGAGWMPIETAPKNNKRPLYLASFNEKGELTGIDWDGSWERESESWEIPLVYYYWASAHGNVEEPTHWAYQDGPPPDAALKESP